MFLSFYLSSTKSRACHAKATGRGAETKGDMCECVACVCVWLGCMCVCECEVCVECVCVSDVCASEWVRACVRACVRGWVGGWEGGREGGERGTEGVSEWVMCVCVNHLKRCKTSNFAGGMRPSCKRMPTKLCMMVEAGADHPGVPALPFQCFQQWDVANPRTTMPFPNKLFSFLVCTVFAIWISANFVRWNSCI